MIDRSSEETQSAAANTTGYIINLGVASVVVTLLIIQGQATLGNIEATSAEAELQTTAERISSTLTEADRMQRIGHQSEGEIPLQLFDLVSTDIGGFEVNITDAAADERGYIIVRPTETTVDTKVNLTYNVDNPVDGKEFTQNENTRVVYNESGVFVR